MCPAVGMVSSTQQALNREGGWGGGGGVGIPVHRFVYRCSVGPGDKGINRSFLNREVRKEEGTLEQEL